MLAVLEDPCFHPIPYHAMLPFDARGSWATLGGSPAGAAYLEKKHQTGASFVASNGSRDSQEEEAMLEASPANELPRHVCGLCVRYMPWR